MPYVIKSIVTEHKTGKQYISYFKGLTMFGWANEMTSLEKAKLFETMSEARRVKRMRFAGRKTEIVKV